MPFRLHFMRLKSLLIVLKNSLALYGKLLSIGTQQKADVDDTKSFLQCSVDDVVPMQWGLTPFPYHFHRSSCDCDGNRVFPEFSES